MRCPDPVSYTHVDVYKRQPKQLPKTMGTLILLVLEKMDKQPVNVITRHMGIQKGVNPHEHDVIWQENGAPTLGPGRPVSKQNKFFDLKGVTKMNYIKSVSYTHLDVYKRQYIYNTVCVNIKSNLNLGDSTRSRSNACLLYTSSL